MDFKEYCEKKIGREIEPEEWDACGEQFHEDYWDEYQEDEMLEKYDAGYDPEDDADGEPDWNDGREDWDEAIANKYRDERDVIDLS